MNYFYNDFLCFLSDIVSRWRYFFCLKVYSLRNMLTWLSWRVCHVLVWMKLPRPYTGLNLNSTRPPLTWSLGHTERGETGIFLWKPHTGSARFEPGTHAWLTRQSGALPIHHVLLCLYGISGLCLYNLDYAHINTLKTTAQSFTWNIAP